MNANIHCHRHMSMNAYSIIRDPVEGAMLGLSPPVVGSPGYATRSVPIHLE